MRENRNFNNGYGCLGQRNRNRGEGFRGNGNGQGFGQGQGLRQGGMRFGRGMNRCNGALFENCRNFGWEKDGFSSNETTENFFGSFENKEQEEIFLKSLKSKVDDRLNEIAKI